MASGLVAGCLGAIADRSKEPIPIPQQAGFGLKC